MSELRPGEKARIVDFSRVHEVVQHRLMYLGMKDHSEIWLRRKLPFGGPYMVMMDGQGIGIRAREAQRIRVERR
nr:FeoA family protein [Paenibacillus turpanensis]